MANKPFWDPTQFGQSLVSLDQYLLSVPILGMLLGNAISAIGVGSNTVNKEFSENRDKVETYLAMGASRFEACKPIACEALKLALLPTVNQMSIIGLISIPGETIIGFSDYRYDDWCDCWWKERRAGCQVAE